MCRFVLDELLFVYRVHDDLVWRERADGWVVPLEVRVERSGGLTPPNLLIDKGLSGSQVETGGPDPRWPYRTTEDMSRGTHDPVFILIKKVDYYILHCGISQIYNTI